MKKLIYRIFPLLLLTVFTVSCIRVDDDDFFDHGGSYYNEGRVSFDGVSIPLTYADFYHMANVQGGEVWALVLSEDFIGQGTTHSDAYLYLEVFKPFGASSEGIYEIYHPMRSIDYAVYYEDVVLRNGLPTSYGFHIPDNSFTDGRLRIQSHLGSVYHIDLNLHTYEGKLLTAYFRGRLRY